MTTINMSFSLSGSAGKEHKYTAKVTNGEFISLVRHGLKKDIPMSYSYGKRIYDARHGYYLSGARGHPKDLPAHVKRYEKDVPAFQEAKRRMRPVHREWTKKQHEARDTYTSILHIIMDIRKCTYKLAQYVFKTVLKPLGVNVEFNAAAPLDPIHLVLQYSNSQIYMVIDAPDYWVDDDNKELVRVYMKYPIGRAAYEDIIWENVGFPEFQDFIESLNRENLVDAVVVGCAGLNYDNAKSSESKTV